LFSYLRARLLDFTVQVNFCCTYCSDLIYSDLMQSPSTKLRSPYTKNVIEMGRISLAASLLLAVALALLAPPSRSKPRPRSGFWRLELLPSAARRCQRRREPGLRPPGPRLGASGAAEPSALS
jgi:hypothetical protein